jgi:hypothetical protein
LEREIEGIKWAAGTEGGIRTRDETMRPRSLGTLRPWRRIQYLFRRMAGDDELPLASSMSMAKPDTQSTVSKQH